MFQRLALFFAMILCLPLPARAAGFHELLAAGGKGGWLNSARPLTAEDMKGRLVLLDFWTYGCINCMQVVPDLEYLEKQFGDKLLVIGVHSAKFSGEQGNERILAAAQRFGLKHPVINDSDFGIWKAVGVHAWPTMVLLGPTGQEIHRYSGEGHRIEIAADIQRALPAIEGAVKPLADLVPVDESGAHPLSFPARLAWAPGTKWGDLLFVVDSGHHRILGVDETGAVKMTIGNGQRGMTDGALAEATFNLPRGAVMMDGALYVADTNNHALRRVDLNAGTVETVAGTGARGGYNIGAGSPARKTALASPWDVEPLANGRSLAVANAGTHQLLTYDTRAGTISILAGSGAEAVDDGKASRAALAQPSGLSRVGETLFFVDAESSALRALTPDGKIKTLIGTGLFDFGLKDGTYPAAMMQHAQGLYAGDNRIILADTYNNALRLYDRKAKTLKTLPLKGGTLAEPGDVLLVKGRLYVVDTNHHAIKIVNLENGELKDFPLSGADALTLP